MGKLSEFFKNSFEKWKSLSKGKKIAVTVGILGIIISLAFYGISSRNSNEAILFSNMSQADSKAVLDKLKEKKYTYHIKGDSIYVDKNQADQIRMEVMSEVSFSDDSKGWELFDNGNQFGPSDMENQVKYQRALQGTLERTIKSFPQVDTARVNLTLPQDSAFVKDSTPATAAVLLTMKPNTKLSNEQIKAIIMLLTGSVKNLPKENVQVADENGLISENIFNSDNTQFNDDTDKQQELKRNYEKYLEDKAMTMLKKIYNDKVSVKVNVDMNFDAVQENSTVFEPNGTVVSEHLVNDANNNTGNNQAQNTGSESPVDSATSAVTTTNTNNNNNNSTHKETTRNYDNSKKETKTIKAPGEVKRVTASVVVSGANLSDNTKTSIKNIVTTAIGVDEKRGDIVSVEGLDFASAGGTNANQADDKTAEKQTQMNKLYTYVAIGAGALLLITTLLVILIRKRKKSKSQGRGVLDEMGIDVVIGEGEGEETKEQPKSKVSFKPIELEPEENQNTHTEKEIKRYALEKPEQVADIIKAWLAEDER